LNKQGAYRLKSFFRYWAPLYVYAGIIFYFSGIPKPLPDIDIPFFDKALHILEFMVFGLLAARAFRNSSRNAFFANFKTLAVLVSISYGISDEFHQRFISERQFSFLDMVADGIGGTIGVLIYGSHRPA